jgi:glycosyltransferase involved in cell wall biosynthesis
MRIVQVNWGWPPGQTGGPIGYVADLSKELVALGHEVFVFYAGDTDFGGRSYLHRKVQEGVRLFSLVNSPNNFLSLGFPKEECREAKTEALFQDFLAEVNPDLVHFHSLLGLSASILEVSKSRGVSNVVSLHNYWFICPRLDLLKPPSYTLCSGPSRGWNCSVCAPRPGRWEVRKAKAKGMFKNLIKRRPTLKRCLQRTILGLNRLRSSFSAFDKNRADSPASGRPDPELARDYLFRENCLRSLLSEKADLIVAVSSSVKEIFVNHGIPEEKIIVLHSGIESLDRLQRFARCQTDSLHSPLTFGFFGPVLPYKGVHILVEAFNLLSPGSARLVVYGTGDSSYIRKLMRKANGNVEFGGAFRDLTDILPEFDVAVIPPIWNDNAPLVVLESLASEKPIIGAEIGGIPDFVKDGINGFLFKPGDPFDLAEKMKEVIESPQLIHLFKENIEPPKSMRQHAGEVSDIYQNLIALKDIGEKRALVEV